MNPLIESVIYNQDSLDWFVKRGITLGVSVYREQVGVWFKELNKIKSLKIHINLSPLPQSYKKLLEKMFILIYLKGYQAVTTDIKRISGASQYTLSGGFDINYHTFDEAILLLKKRKVVPYEIFQQMSGDIRRASFSVARIDRMNAMVMVNKKIQSIISEGGSVLDFKKAIAPMFEAYGVTPLKPYHIENVFRTNTQTVYNISRYNGVMDSPNTTALEYTAVLDNRTRPEHAQWDGFRAPKNSTVWATLLPPLDYQCRCTTIPLTDYYIKKKGLDMSPIPRKFPKLNPDFMSKSLKDLSTKGFVNNLIKREMQVTKNLS